MLKKVAGVQITVFGHGAKYANDGRGFSFIMKSPHSYSGMEGNYHIPQPRRCAIEILV